MSEFNLIDRFFKGLTIQRDDVHLAIGDDCAIMQVPEGQYLATSTDTLISGVHFPAHTQAFDIGYKALAVNLSDLAAMGAKPAWVSLALTLPERNNRWLDDFSNGFAKLAKLHNVQLIGGDTTRGELSITVQIYGFLEPNKVLRRDKAKPGDLIYVSGCLGDAGIGLQCVLNQLESEISLTTCVDKLNRPVPRVELGEALVELSQCAIDISDGLAADLQHIVEESQCAARVELESIPLSKELKSYYGSKVDWKQVLTSGDDYELCFTVSPSEQRNLNKLAARLDIKLTPVGIIKEGAGIEFINREGETADLQVTGYNHFL